MVYKRYLFSATVKRSALSMQKARAKKRTLKERSTTTEVQADEIPIPFSDDTDATFIADSTEETDFQRSNQDTTESEVLTSNEKNDQEIQSAAVFETENDPFSGKEENLSGTSAAPAHEKSQHISPPLCCHTECTADDVLIMTLSLVWRHKLTWAALSDVLKMVNVIFGGKKIKASKFSFLKKIFSREKEKEISYHYFCDDCAVYIKKKGTNPKDEVACQTCKKVVSNPLTATYFASLSLGSQLKELLKDDNIAEKILQHRFNRTKLKEDNFEDIYDGLEYRKLSCPGGVLSHPQNFSYSFFTDGVAVGRRKKSLWPIYVSINELPPKERRKHILLVGLYYSKHDPNHQFFLKPFAKEANKLSSKGFEWDHRGERMLSKVIPLIAVADSVARCQMLNFQTFSAFYGCTFCYQMPTRTTQKLKYAIPKERAQERTKESYKIDLQKAYERRFEVQEKNRHCRGVKGPSSLTDLQYFNLLSGCVVDYMHNILIGCCKSYFELVFESSRRKFWKLLAKDEEEKFTIEDVKIEIDSRLLRITPPTCINRAPRSVKEMCSWKANEWRSWLLFYSIPCLLGLLRNKHLAHFTMLANATTLLLQNSISREDIDEAHRLFMAFTYDFQKYFGPENMFFNIHLLSHICKGVLRWGPISFHNSFMYESYNRTLLQMCKNPFRVVTEVCKKYLILKDFPKLLDELTSSETPIFFCEKILNQGLVLMKRGDTCILLGAGSHCDLSTVEREFLQSNGFNPSLCLYYSRLLLKGMRLTIKRYALDKKNDDSVVYTADGEICRILAIYSSENTSVNLLVAKVELLESPVFTSGHVTTQHIYGISNFGNMKILHPRDISGQCVFVKPGVEMYISKMPYGCYGD